MTADFSSEAWRWDDVSGVLKEKSLPAKNSISAKTSSQK
jgi:hypothetical protein